MLVNDFVKRIWYLRINNNKKKSVKCIVLYYLINLKFYELIGEYILFYFNYFKYLYLFFFVLFIGK